MKDLEYIRSSKFVRIILTSLLEKNESTLMEIAKTNNIFIYSALVESRKILESNELVVSTKDGRNRILRLTDKGKRVAEALKNADDILSNI